VTDDNLEIEIHNLNEVNEYFRIFKDHIKQLNQKLVMAKSPGIALSHLNLKSKVDDPSQFHLVETENV
jgi:hypothetical protein